MEISAVCCADSWPCLPPTVRAQRINSAIVTCLEHVATSTAPPGAGAADFLLRLLDDGVYCLEEIDEITRRVSIILRGITERHQLSQPGSLAGLPDLDDHRGRVTRHAADFQKATAALRRGLAP
jgi:hypothetical protein